MSELNRLPVWRGGSLWAAFHWSRFRCNWHRLRLMVHARGRRAGLVHWLSHLRPIQRRGCNSPAPLAWRQGQRAEPGRHRILLIDAALPRPDRDSGSLRAFNLMRLLLAEGHAVDFMADDGVQTGEYALALSALGVGLPARRGGWLRWFAALTTPYDTVIISRYRLAYCMIPLLRGLHPATRIVFDTVDLHHLREQREAGLKDDSRLRHLAATTRRGELAAMAAADTTWVVSPEEVEIIAREMPQVHCMLVPNLHEVAPIALPFEQRQGIVFVGGAVHPPNIDAVRWLIEDIAPRVWKVLPGCPFHLVGDGLRAALPDSLQIPDGIHLHGYVRDLAPLLGQCRISVAPLRFGAGVNGKINQAMAAGLPVVATRWLGRSLNARDGDDIVLADDAQTLAAAIIRLYGDAELLSASSQGSVSLRVSSA